LLGRSLSEEIVQGSVPTDVECIDVNVALLK
jgi:hypothetical protein